MKQCKNCMQITENEKEVFCTRCGESFLADPIKRFFHRRKVRKQMYGPIGPIVPADYRGYSPSAPSAPQYNGANAVYDPINWSADPGDDFKDPNPFFRMISWVTDLICGPLVMEPVRVVLPNYFHPISAKCSHCGWHGDWNTAPSPGYVGDGFKGKLCPSCGERLI